MSRLNSRLSFHGGYCYYYYLLRNVFSLIGYVILCNISSIGFTIPAAYLYLYYPRIGTVCIVRTLLLQKSHKKNNPYTIRSAKYISII